MGSGQPFPFQQQHPAGGAEVGDLILRGRNLLQPPLPCDGIGFERIARRNLVNTYLRSKVEDTRRKALKYGAQGSTTKAYRPI